MRTGICGLVSLAFLFSAVLVAVGDEEKIPLAKLPKKVISAVKTKYPGAKLISATKEIEEGETYYNVSIKHKDEDLELTFTPRGKLVEIAREIDVEDLPKAVAEAIQKKYPKSTITEADEIIEVEEGNRKSYYVVVESAEKKMFEITLDPKGKILKTKAKSKSDK
jgi:hypothetical protein